VIDQIQCKNKKEYGKPISWSVEDHGEYYIIKCLVDVELNPYINFSTSDGVIGVDCNYHHIAWTDVSKDGLTLATGADGDSRNWVHCHAFFGCHTNGRWCTFYMCFYRHIAGRPEMDTSDISYGYSSR
jgi:hypothetical protein